MLFEAKSDELCPEGGKTHPQNSSPSLIDLRHAEFRDILEHLPPDLQGSREIFEQVIARTLDHEGPIYEKRAGDPLWTPERRIIHPNYRPPKRTRLDSLPSLDQILWDEILPWADDEGESILVVAASGLPGTGKTTFANKVRKIAEQIGGLNAYVLGTDSFLRIEREHEEEREKIARNPRLWRRLAYSQAIISNALMDACKIDGQSGAIKFNGYKNGSIGEQIYQIGEGKKIYIVEGIYAIEHLDILQRRTGIPGIRIYLDGAPGETYDQAVDRDAAAGTRSRKSAGIIQMNLRGHLISYGDALKIKLADYIVTTRLKSFYPIGTSVQIEREPLIKLAA